MYEENQLADLSINFDDEINSNGSSSQISSSQLPNTSATRPPFRYLQGAHLPEIANPRTDHLSDTPNITFAKYFILIF